MNKILVFMSLSYYLFGLVAHSSLAPKYKSESEIKGLINWTKRNIQNGYAGTLATSRNLRESKGLFIEDLQSSLNRKWKEQYTAKGTAGKIIKTVDFKKIKYKRIKNFNKEFYKNTFNLNFTKKLGRKLLDGSIEYMSDIYEFDAYYYKESPPKSDLEHINYIVRTEPSEIKRAVKVTAVGMWIFSKTGAFFLIGVPSMASAELASGSIEITTSVFSRILVTVAQGMHSLGTTMRFPLEILKYPAAIVASTLHQVWLTGLTTLNLSTFATISAITVAAHVVQSSAVITAAVTAGLGYGVYELLSWSTYKGIRALIGYREKSYYFDIQDFAKHFLQYSSDCIFRLRYFERGDVEQILSAENSNAHLTLLKEFLLKFFSNHKDFDLVIKKENHNKTEISFLDNQTSKIIFTAILKSDFSQPIIKLKYYKRNIKSFIDARSASTLENHHEEFIKYIDREMNIFRNYIISKDSMLPPQDLLDLLNQGHYGDNYHPVLRKYVSLFKFYTGYDQEGNIREEVQNENGHFQELRPIKLPHNICQYGFYIKNLLR